MGRNIRAGAHYTQFVVYDFDGDGRAEIIMKTSDGTIDGQEISSEMPLPIIVNQGTLHNPPAATSLKKIPAVNHARRSFAQSGTYSDRQ